MNSKSDGETLVYHKIKRDCPESTVLHSVFLRRHVKNISGEIDLLVLIPNEGFFCLEVKHGGVERLEDNTWRYTDRNNQTTIKSKGPFEQVSDAMHSLKAMIPKIFKKDSDIQRFKRIMFGTAVVFSSLDEFDHHGTEAEKWEVFLRRHLDEIKRNLYRLSSNWHEKYASTPTARWYDDKDSRPTRKECEIFRNALRGDFCYEYSLINRLTDEEHRIEMFTEQQFDLIDSTYENPRNLILGGAGSGKTIMALEIARRKASENLKVGFFCYNRLLGEELKGKIETLTNNTFSKGGCEAGTIDSFMMRVTNLKADAETDKDIFFRSTLPFAFAFEFADKPESEKFDYLVIDEAQDLLSESHLDAIDGMLKNGISNGQWTMLGDFNNQALYTDSKPEALIDTLRFKASISLLRLKYNCRNPRVINEKNSSMTGCERLIPWEGMPEGEDVKKTFVDTVTDAIKTIETIILELANKKVPYKKISLLSQRDTIDLIGGSKTIGDAIGKGMVMETVKSYKGLENSYIVLYDFHTLDSEEGIKTLYVGISRAKFKLYLVFSRSLKEDYENLIRRHIKP
jgi:hypothetical protein